MVPSLTGRRRMSSAQESEGGEIIEFRDFSEKKTTRRCRQVKIRDQWTEGYQFYLGQAWSGF